jgi:hypothetical protein
MLAFFFLFFLVGSNKHFHGVLMRKREFKNWAEAGDGVWRTKDQKGLLEKDGVHAFSSASFGVHQRQIMRKDDEDMYEANP